MEKKSELKKNGQDSQNTVFDGKSYNLDEYRRNKDKKKNRKKTRKAKKRERKKLNKTSRKNDYITNILLILCVCIFLIGGWNLFSIFAEYNAGTETYENIKELAISVPGIEFEETTDLNESEVVEPTYADYYVDFDVLSEINSEVVAWIRFDAPEIISYPVVQTDNNDTYLKIAFTGESNSAGTLFIDVKNSSDFSDDNTIIYGHNMKNDSMFGALSEYIEEDFYKEYPYFYVYLPDGTASKYEIAAVDIISVTDIDRYTMNFASSSSFLAYINTMLRTSFYDSDATLSSSASLITLSTCTGDDSERFIVQGVKVDEKEMAIPVQ